MRKIVFSSFSWPQKKTLLPFKRHKLDNPNTNFTKFFIGLPTEQSTSRKTHCDTQLMLSIVQLCGRQMDAPSGRCDTGRDHGIVCFAIMLIWLLLRRYQCCNLVLYWFERFVVFWCGLGIYKVWIKECDMLWKNKIVGGWHSTLFA